MNAKLRITLFLFFFQSFFLHLSANMDDYKYYFNKPASIWEESIPLGNGRIGMMPWGGVDQERVVLNEISLWSGKKQNADNPEAYKHLSQIRKLLFEGKNDEAQELMYKTFTCLGEGSAGGSYGKFQNFANLYIDFQYQDPLIDVTDYKRELNIGTAVSMTSFKRNNVVYSREYFTSFADDIGILHLTVDKKQKLNFVIGLTRDERYQVKVADNHLTIYGRLFDGDGNTGMSYYGCVQVQTSDGKISYEDSLVRVQNASIADVFISIATDYYKSDPQSLAGTLLKKEEGLEYNLLKSRHIEKYEKMFDRVQLSLRKNENSNLPINDRLIAFVNDHSDADLPALYFQYGRYLLISSTRPGNLPPNLQGLWAPQINTPWNGDYHLNINLQMNLWPAEMGNLSELQEPLIEYVKGLVEPGEKTAKIYYNSRGWVTHILGNVWGFTSPGEHPSWGATNTSGAWLCQHLWEHYLYSMDEKYLASIYPILKGASLFFSDMLIEDPRNHYLVTAPTTSPENSYILFNGKNVSICAGSTMDNQIVRELFTNTIHAAEILQTDHSFTNELQNKLTQIAPTRIGKYGQIMEWMEDYEEVETHHRHVSQLYGLHPGNELTYEKTPELMEAAKMTLNRRGDESTGWSMAWKINFWARLKDGERAYKLIGDLLNPAGSGGGTYPSLFSAHPPMQIDGNFGGCAGIGEMLLQSHAGYIEILPAIPLAWLSGAFSGLKVRGGGEVSAKWENGVIKELELKASVANEFKLKIPANWNMQQIQSSTEIKNKMTGDTMIVKLNEGETIRLKYKSN